MHKHHLHFLVFLFHFLIITLTLTFSQPNANTNPSCPLNFNLLTNNLVTTPSNATCQFIRQLFRLLQSNYLQRTNSFFPPSNSSDACWQSYNEFLHDTTVRTRCGFTTPWISNNCFNVTTRAQFEARVSSDSMNDVVSGCQQSLYGNSPCASCTTALSAISVCADFSFIYVAAFVNRFGPGDVGTARCLFNLDFVSDSNRRRKSRIVIVVIVVVVVVVFVVVCGLVLMMWFFVLRGRNGVDGRGEVVGVDLGLDLISGRTRLVRYTFEEIKRATGGFSRENMIGKGGYGNVYKGTLEDGTEVAMKRFKNCSVAGDGSFKHEVEVIASVRHVNLVGLRGYCTETMPLEGYQRIIVCELMRNGSVHDHLFGGEVGGRLSWDVRRRIAVGTARGLAYLHYGAQPAIIHRDIKGSNILLDEEFEPKLADFGLAKFTPEGMTHLSTRIAGTLGYVAPEYALYGQVTERSDVYSFGIVLLELFSGKKALMDGGDGQPLLVADWAWSLVRKGRVMEVIEDGMADLGPLEVVEKYVLVAVLCSHPQPYARPTMDQVVKMLDMDVPVPVIPERPISIISSIDDIERSVNSGGSGHFSTSAGYQPYMIEQERGLRQKEDNETLGDR